MFQLIDRAWTTTAVAAAAGCMDGVHDIHKAGVAEAGAEGGSLFFASYFFNFHLFCLIYFIILFLVVAAEVLVEVDWSRLGRAPALNRCCWQLLLMAAAA